MTLKEYLEQATYAYISSVDKRTFLTQLWKREGVIRAEKYLKDMPEQIQNIIEQNKNKNITLDEEQALEQKILRDLKSSHSELAASTDYKAHVALAVLAYQNQCSVDILLLGLSDCARDNQNNMQPIIITAQVYTLPDLETLKNNLISSCIRGSEIDKDLLAKKIKLIKAMTGLAYELNCDYKVMADAAVACLEKLKQKNPDLTMSVLLRKLIKKSQPELQALSQELHKESDVMEMDIINQSALPQAPRM